MKRALVFSFSGAVLLFYLFSIIPSAFASHLDGTFWGTWKARLRFPLGEILSKSPLAARSLSCPTEPLP